jgi:LacI family transcriptional regulator
MAQSRQPHYILSVSDYPPAETVLSAFRQRWAELSELPVFNGHLGSVAARSRDCLGCVAFLSHLDMVRAATELGKPVINFSNRLGPFAGGLNVFSDDAEIGRMAAQACMRQQLRRFYYVAHSRVGFSADREGGFRAALAEAGNAVESFVWSMDPDVNPTHFSDAQAASYRGWLKRMVFPAALFGSNDLTLADFLGFVAREAPAEFMRLSAIGVDDSRLMIAGRGLSSIVPNWPGIGWRMAELLHGVLAGGGWEPGAVYRVGGARLVERASTRPLMTRDALVARVLEYFRRRIDAGLSPTVAAAAVEFKVSRRTLSGRFGEAVGMSPRDYLIQARLLEAQRLLRETGLTIAEIAQRCGFSKQSSFTYRFRCAFGMTPRDYRRADP